MLRRESNTIETYDNWFIYPEGHKLNCTQMSTCAYGTLLFNEFNAMLFTLFMIYLFVYACIHIPKSFKKAKKFKIHVKKRDKTDKKTGNKEIENADEIKRIEEKTRQLEQV